MIENHHLPALPLPSCAVVRQRWHGGIVGLPTARILAEEIAVAANYEGATHAVLMMTPDDLEDFAVGFSVTEGIIRDPGEIADLEIMGHPDGIVLRMWLVGDRSHALTARRRRFVGPAGCGMCGQESLAEAHRAIKPISTGDRVRDGRPAAAGIIVVSSRITIELVQKAGMIGALILVGVSAPTALAVRTAEAIGITLVGIARDA